MKIISDIREFSKLSNPPKFCYYRGNIELLKMPKISIVGSRKMSLYTRDLIRQLCTKIKNNFCVVSGGALGCDISSHEFALPNTIGVFANGLNNIYPQTNKNLIEQIYSKGLALSENEPDFMPSRYSFLNRNRLIVALGQMLIIAQADIKSGSMKSAQYAMKLGIPIYVFPHKISESTGTNFLLAKNMANLINDIDEFVLKTCGIEPTKIVFDEVINFLKHNDNFDKAFEIFGDKIYEYELDGKIEICANRIKIL